MSTHARTHHVMPDPGVIPLAVYLTDLGLLDHTQVFGEAVSVHDPTRTVRSRWRTVPAEVQLHLRPQCYHVPDENDRTGRVVIKPVTIDAFRRALRNPRDSWETPRTTLCSLCGMAPIGGYAPDAEPDALHQKLEHMRPLRMHVSWALWATLVLERRVRARHNATLVAIGAAKMLRAAWQHLPDLSDPVTRLNLIDAGVLDASGIEALHTHLVDLHERLCSFTPPRWARRFDRGYPCALGGTETWVLLGNQMWPHAFGVADETETIAMIAVAFSSTDPVLATGGDTWSPRWLCKVGETTLADLQRWRATADTVARLFGYGAPEAATHQHVQTALDLYGKTPTMRNVDLPHTDPDRYDEYRAERILHAVLATEN